MHAYLFVGGDPEIREKTMRKAAEKKGEVLYEFNLLKIEDVRKLAEFTKFAQIKTISILIKDINLATNEALNAFLKNLEEPGKNISYFLSCNSQETMLSTISSRCQITRIQGKSKKRYTDAYFNFLKLSTGQKFKILEPIRKKDEAKKFLEDFVRDAHRVMVQGKEDTLVSAAFIKAAQTAIININANANVNLQMLKFAIQSTKSGLQEHV